MRGRVTGFAREDPNPDGADNHQDILYQKLYHMASRQNSHNVS